MYMLQNGYNRVMIMIMLNVLFMRSREGVALVKPGVFNKFSNLFSLSGMLLMGLIYFDKCPNL